MKIVAYDWSRWNDFLLPTLFPNADRWGATIGEHLESALAKVGELTPGTRLVFHVNLTDTKSFFPWRREIMSAAVAENMKVWNWGVESISKRSIARSCQQAGLPSLEAPMHGDLDELLIVKTDRNYGGEPEDRLSNEQMASLGLPRYKSVLRSDHGYKVLKRRRITPSAWLSPELVIERFVENLHRRFYRVFVIENSMAVMECIEDAEIKSFDRSKRLQTLFVRSSDEIRADRENSRLFLVSSIASKFVKEFRLDFGCLDILEDAEGKFFVCDATTTPYWGDVSEPEVVTFLRQCVLEAAPN